MSIILEALKKAEQKFREASSNVTTGEGARSSKQAWETTDYRRTQQTAIPNNLFDAREQGSRSPFKPRLVAGTALTLFLLTGAIAAGVRFRPAATATVPANAEVSHHGGAPQASQWSGPLTLRGEIAHGLNIEMQLVREGSRLSGSYAYERIGKDIQLQGTIAETGSLVLEEFVKGRKTGTFVGKFVSATRIDGKWSKPGSTRTRDFFLVSTGLLSGDFSHIMPDLPKNQLSP